MTGNTDWKHGRCFTLDHYYVILAANQMSKFWLLSKLLSKFTFSMKISFTLKWPSPLTSTPIALRSISFITPGALPCNAVISMQVSSLQLHCRDPEVQRSCLIHPDHTCAQSQTQQTLSSKSWLSSTVAAEWLRTAASSKKPLLGLGRILFFIKKFDHIVSHLITTCLPLAISKIWVSSFSKFNNIFRRSNK